MNTPLAAHSDFIEWRGDDENSSFIRDWVQKALPEEAANSVARAEHAVQVMDVTTDGVLILTTAGIGTYANEAACRMLGLSREEILGKDVHQIVHSRTCNKNTCNLAYPAISGISINDTYDNFNTATGVLPVQLRVHPLVDGGVVKSVVVIFMDVTAMMEQMAAAEQAKAALADALHKQQEIDAHKTDFIYTVSHELRTPLTSILGFTEMSLETDSAEEIHEYLEPVLRNAKRLLDQVEDLLMVAKIENNALKVEPEQINILESVNTVVGSIHPLLEKKSVTVEVDCPPDLILNADPKHLEQVLTNLLSNATKFSHDGGTVYIDCRPERNGVYIQVEDMGLGIPESEKSSMFSRFYRTTTARDMAIPGTGLGLVIVKAIVESNGGKIGFDSEEGKGTAFGVYWPNVAPPAHVSEN